MNFRRACSILGVSGTETDAELRQVYMDLVKIWHPDRFHSEGQTRIRRRAAGTMVELNAAYEFLIGLGIEGRRRTATSNHQEEKLETPTPNNPQHREPATQGQQYQGANSSKPQVSKLQAALVAVFLLGLALVAPALFLLIGGMGLLALAFIPNTRRPLAQIAGSALVFFGLAVVVFLGVVLVKAEKLMDSKAWIFVVAPDGGQGVLASEEFSRASEMGLRIDEERTAASRASGRAFAEGVCRGASFGLSDAFLEGALGAPYTGADGHVYSGGLRLAPGTTTALDHSAQLYARRAENPLASSVGSSVPIAYLIFVWLLSWHRAKPRTFAATATRTVLGLLVSIGVAVFLFPKQASRKRFVAPTVPVRANSKGTVITAPRVCDADCKRSRAGYNWAERNGIESDDECEGTGAFLDGCMEYVEEVSPSR